MAQIILDVDTNAGVVSAEFSDLGDSVKKTDKKMSAMGGSAKKLNKLFGALGLTGAMMKLGQTMQQSSQMAFEFNDSMTALLALGDNVRNIDATKKAVEDLAVSTGISTGQVANAMFTLQSATSNLSKTMRDDLLKQAIELSKVNSTDLQTSVNAMATVWQIYGNSLEDANDLQNKLQLAAENGKMTFDDLATLLPDVASAADAMGGSLDDVLGALVVATQRGGRAEKTFTGVRNIFLRLNKAEKENIKLTGTFAEKIQQLSAVDSDTLKKIFGDESVAVIANLVKFSSQLRAETNTLAKVEGDITGQKHKQRMETDAAYRTQQEVLKTEQEIDRVMRNSWMAKEWPKYMAARKLEAVQMLSGINPFTASVVRDSIKKQEQANDTTQAIREQLGRQDATPAQAVELAQNMGMSRSEAVSMAQQSALERGQNFSASQIMRMVMEASKQGATAGTQTGKQMGGGNPTE